MRWVGVCFVPPHPSPLPQERESDGTPLENSDVAVAVPASLSFVAVAHANQARSYYQITGESAPEHRPKGNMALSH